MTNILVIVQISNINESVPNRAVLPLGNNKEPGLVFLVNRLKKIENVDIAIATTTDIKDDIFEKIAKECEVRIYRGSYHNVAARLLYVCEDNGAENFVKVNGNCPLVDIGLMQKLYQEHIRGGYDYSYNEHLKGLLWGMGCEIFNVNFLRTLSSSSLTDSQQQTIGIYIRQNQELFKVQKYQMYLEKRPSYKLNLETMKDYEVINDVASNLVDINCENVADYLSKHLVIAKHNLEARPKEAGLEKIFFNLPKVRSLLEKNVPDNTYPISVEMTLTNACNMNCVYCSDAMLRKRQGMCEMISLNSFKHLFKDLSSGGTKGIVIEGGGEPTLYSHFNEVIDCAVENGLAVGLITNGSIRLSENILKKFEWIRVSLDASTQEEYKALKGVDLYEKVIDNIAYYAKHCNTVGVGYVVTSKNISQIESLVMRIRELKASYIQLRPVVDSEELYPEGIDLSYLKFYMTKEFGVQVDGMIENSEGGNHALPCYTSSITSVISGDGSVYICGRLNVYDWLKPIGNINEQSFHDIWYGEERRKQVEMIGNPDFCKKNCPQCRVSKFNVLFDKLYGIKSVHFI